MASGQLTTVANTSQQIHAGTRTFGGGPVTYVTVTNGAVAVFIGSGSGVTTTTGMPVGIGQTVQVVCGPDDQVWCVSGGVTIVGFYKNDSYSPGLTR